MDILRFMLLRLIFLLLAGRPATMTAAISNLQRANAELQAANVILQKTDPSDFSNFRLAKTAYDLADVDVKQAQADIERLEKR